MSALHVKKDVDHVKSVSRETRDKLQVYADLLTEWQRAINLVSAATLPMVWERHIWDSAQLADYIPHDRSYDTGVPCLVDLGSGAGFPGLVLAIMGVATVHLIESDQRKCAFLREVARATATSVTIHAERIESLRPFPADMITARALAPLDRLLSYAEPFLAPHTRCLFLKGKNVESELASITTQDAVVNGRFTMTQHPSKTEEGAVILELVPADTSRGAV